MADRAAQGGAQPFEDHAALGDRDRLLHGDHPHPRAAVGDALDQPFGGEVDEGGADGGPRDAVHLGQVGLDQQLAGGEVAARQRAPQGVGGDAGTAAPSLGVSGHGHLLREC